MTNIKVTYPIDNAIEHNKYSKRKRKEKEEEE